MLIFLNCFWIEPQKPALNGAISSLFVFAKGEVVRQVDLTLLNIAWKSAAWNSTGWSEYMCVFLLFIYLILFYFIFIFSLLIWVNIKYRKLYFEWIYRLFKVNERDLTWLCPLYYIFDFYLRNRCRNKTKL